MVEQASFSHVAKVQDIDDTVGFIRFQGDQDHAMKIGRPSSENLDCGPILVSPILRS